MIDRESPSRAAASARSVAKNASISAGVKTAVGSSSSEHARFAREFAQDLDALRDADGKRFDERVRIDVQAVRASQPRHAFAGGRAIDAPAPARFAAEHHVFPDAQALDQFEVLVHEADAPVALDASRGRREPARGDRRERRFAGSVLTAERVDLAGKQR